MGKQARWSLYLFLRNYWYLTITMHFDRSAHERFDAEQLRKRDIGRMRHI